jgi:hypothetical protein
MSGASISATSIPNTALQSTVTINDTASTFSALKTFTGGIAASGTQTINFGSNAPTMSGASIASGTIPTSAITGYGSGFATQTGANSFTALNTFTGGITASGTQTITFGSNAPTMSGASIGSGTIPFASLASDVRYWSISNTSNFFSGTSSGTSLTTGDSNTLCGYNSGVSITTGTRNTCMGVRSGNNLLNGASSNTGIGWYSLGGGAGAAVGSYNTGIGDSALLSISTGTANTAVGFNSAPNITTGKNNNFIGNYAGTNIVIGESNTGIGDNCASGTFDSSNCTFLGANTTVAVAGQSFTTCVGAGTTCAASNTIQLGSNNEEVVVSGKLVLKSFYVNSSFSLTTGTTLTLSDPLYEIYPLAPTANLVITLPVAAITYRGVRIYFRRTGGTTTTTITSATSNLYPSNSLTLTNSIMASGVYTAAIYCTYVTSTTFAWYLA